MMIQIYKLIAVVATAVAINGQCNFTSQDGSYSTSWYLDATNQIVHFKLTARLVSLGNSFWTGIGFGDKMLGGDFIIITVVDNQFRFGDRHGIGYEEPKVDIRQDVYNYNGRLENGVIYADFTRAVNTNDPEDLPIIDISKSYCQDFIFPVSGGVATPTGTSIHKHSVTPTVQRICRIEQCTSFADGRQIIDPPRGESGTISETARLDRFLVIIVLAFFLFGI